MWSIRLLLIETGIWLTPIIAVEGGDGAAEATNGAGDGTTSNELARNVLYMLKNFHSNSGVVEYSPTVDRDRYLACSTHGGSER
jgi:hypothetical protein